MSFLTSQDTIATTMWAAINSGLIMAAMIAGFAFSVAGIWLGGCYFGRPVATFIIGIFPPDTTLTPAQVATTQRVLGGVIAVFLCFIVFLADIVAADVEEKARGHALKWTLWRFVLIFIKAVIGGLSAVAILSGCVRILRLS